MLTPHYQVFTSSNLYPGNLLASGPNMNPGTPSITGVSACCRVPPHGFCYCVCVYIYTMCSTMYIQCTIPCYTLPPRGLLNSSHLYMQLLEACVKNCGQRFHQEMGKFRFLNELIRMISPKVKPFIRTCTCRSHNDSVVCITYM